MELLLVILPNIALFGFAALQLQKYRKRMRQPITDDRCVACNSTAVSPLAAGAYLCELCGYEGGPGYKRYRARAQKERIERLSPKERAASGLEDLEEAKLLLLGAKGIICNAESLSKTDIVGLSNDKGAHKQQVFIGAHRDIMLSEELIRSASFKLKEDLDFSQLSIDFRAPTFRHDLGFSRGGAETRADFETHRQINESKHHVQELLNLIEAALHTMQKRA